MTDRPLPADEWPDHPEDELAEGFPAELELDEDVDEFADEVRATVKSDPVVDPNDERLGPTFFDAGIDLHALDDLDLVGRVSVLERLGPAHFRSKGFSFMGFLQTVYDHIAEEIARPPATPDEVPSLDTPGEGRVRDDAGDGASAEDISSSREVGRPSP